MSAQGATAFLDRLEEDSEFAAKLEAVKEDATAVQAMVREAGFDATPEEIKDAFLARYGETLSPEQLDAVAGGMETEGIIAVSTFAGLAVIGVSAAAAAAF